MKNLCRIMSLLLVTVMLISLLPGCSNEEPANKEDYAGDEKYGGKPVKLSVFWNYDHLDPLGEWGEDPVSAEILKKTGITIERASAVSDPGNKINLMIASGELPDMIWSDPGDIVEKLVSSNSVIALDEMIANKAPDILKNVPGDIINGLRSLNDNKLYLLPNSFREVVANGASVQIRKDIFEALGCPDIKTPEDYYQLIKSVRDLNFKSLDEKDVIPYGMWSEALNIGTVAGFWGMKSYYEFAVSEDEKSIVSLYKHPKMIEALKFVNRLYREGLMDTELFTQQQFQVDEKLNNGRYAVVNLWAFWQLDTANDTLKRNGMEKSRYIVINTPKAPGVEKATMCAESKTGWNVSMITSQCKYPERAIQLADFLLSEEGQMLTIYGIEGKHYEIENGQIIRAQEVIDGFLNSGDVESYKMSTGIDLFAWYKNMNYQYKNMQLYDEQYQANWEIAKENAWDSTATAGINPPSQSEENKILAKGYTIFWTNYYPRMIMSVKDDAELEKLYHEMLAELDKIQIEKLEAYWTNAYTEKRKRLGLE